MRNCIAGTTPRQKLLRVRDILRENRRNAEMPMNEGFLRCHDFCHGEKTRRDSAISRRIFRTQRRRRSRLRDAKKILHRMRLSTCSRASRGAKRANQCQAIRGDGTFADRMWRRRAADLVPFRLATSTPSVRAYAKTAATRRSAQMPIFFLSRSLTACGLALPPDAFIT
jgi:hypothetical protein